MRQTAESWEQVSLCRRSVLSNKDYVPYSTFQITELDDVLTQIILTAQKHFTWIAIKPASNDPMNATPPPPRDNSKQSRNKHWLDWRFMEMASSTLRKNVYNTNGIIHNVETIDMSTLRKNVYSTNGIINDVKNYSKQSSISLERVNS